MNPEFCFSRFSSCRRRWSPHAVFTSPHNY